MKKAVFAITLSLLLAGASVISSASANEDDSAFSTQTKVDNIIAQKEAEHLTGKGEKERKRELARLKKQYELEKRKERWTNINGDTKKKDEIRRKAIDAANSGGQFDDSKLSKPVREYIQKQTPDDAAQNKKEVLRTWTQLSPDQKAYIKKSGKEKWKTLTKEEQEQFKAIMAYEKTVNGTTQDTDTSPKKPLYAGRKFLSGNAHNGQTGQGLTSGGSGNGYSYSMFGPGGARREAGSRSYGDADSSGNGN